MSFVVGFDQVGSQDVALVGGKGASLSELIRAGLPVPPGFVLTTAAYRDFVDRTGIGPALLALAALAPDATPEEFARASAGIGELFASHAVPEPAVAELATAYAELGDRAGEGSDGVPVAVRSSATAEDLPGASFAGQQETFLDVRGLDALVRAVRDCWASLWTARAMAYRARRELDPAEVSLAVVVQRMVDATAAGVMFTANPGTGRRDEILVSAAWGLGESVVGGTVTTDVVVVSRSRGEVTSRTTADQAVMTVATGHGTAERPVPPELRAQPVLDDAAAVELARLGERIEAHAGVPQDVEWARAEGGFFVVQARPITGLPGPVGEPPTDWTVPRPRDWYLRASIVEQLPDPLTPLFADLIDPAVTRSLGALFRELLGGNSLREGDLGLPTVNGYAYYRYTRSALLRFTLRSPGAMMSIFSAGERGGVGRWRLRAQPTYTRIVEEWTARPLAELSDDALLAGAAQLIDAGAEYYTSVQAIIPLATTAELCFTAYYDRLVRRASDPPAATFLLGFDSEPIRAEKSLYDLACWARDHDPALESEAWWQRFAEHLRRYGHMVYNLDVVNPVPADDPEPLLATVRMYLRGDGTDPYRRQAGLTARRQERTAAVRARLDPVRRAGFDRLLRWAQDVGPLREDALAGVGLAWPRIRQLLAELGRRLTDAGRVDRPDDVFWLHPDEIGGRVPIGDGAVAERRARWRGQRLVTPPQLLPQGTVLDRFSSFLPAVRQEQTGNVIKGIPASGGRVTAPARVLAGPGDFGRMRPGDVLVTGITTPAWTSLFAMASAVVTDIGGPLSHSSIVAREYGIPAVLGTNVATRRIPDGSRILVDGDAGTVTLLDEPGGGELHQRPEQRRLPRPGAGETRQ
jgi:phosphohistidine swiveling domain-containing protein